MRQRGGTTGRRDHDGAATSSAREIGRRLRQAREERGLDLLAVHDRLSRPITQLECLEQGDLAGLPDQALALATLRRYAAFLGLDGDALALELLDAWSATGPAPAAGAAGPAGAAGTGAPAETVAVPAVVADSPIGPDHLRAFTRTGPVGAVGGAAATTTTVAAVGGYHAAAGPPTGTFPVVPQREIRDSKRAVARARRQRRAPAALKAVTWTVAGLLVVAVAGLVIYRVHPRWLVQAHVLRVVEPGGPGTGPPTSPAAPQVVMTSSGPQSAAYSVSSKAFSVDIQTSGECWLQVTTSASASPLVVGVQPAGKSLSFPSSGVMTVQVGSAAVVVGISIDGKNAYFNRPVSTPFTYTFTPTGT